jgi:hypothetical protein
LEWLIPNALFPCALREWHDLCTNYNMQKSIIGSFIFVALLTALPTSSAMAGELSAVINGKSYHVNSTYDWNEDNYGLGAEYEFTSKSRWKKTAMVNGFRDSNKSMSYMAGAGLHRRLFETDRLSGFYVDAGINAFIMTREDVRNNKPFPGMLPSLSVGNQYIGFNLTYLPKKAVQDIIHADMADPTISGIVFLQFKVRISQFLAR